jgi:hypothetical protein
MVHARNSHKSWSEKSEEKRMQMEEIGLEGVGSVYLA